MFFNPTSCSTKRLSELIVIEDLRFVLLFVSPLGGEYNEGLASDPVILIHDGDARCCVEFELRWNSYGGHNSVIDEGRSLLKLDQQISDGFCGFSNLWCLAAAILQCSLITTLLKRSQPFSLPLRVTAGIRWLRLWHSRYGLSHGRGEDNHGCTKSTRHSSRAVKERECCLAHRHVVGVNLCVNDRHQLVGVPQAKQVKLYRPGWICMLPGLEMHRMRETPPSPKEHPRCFL
jgi:hypothetical protein